MVDEILGSDRDWNENIKRLPREVLKEGIRTILGHPVQYAGIKDENVENFRKWLEINDEPVLERIVSKLRERKDIDNHGIRAVIMWITANAGFLKNKDWQIHRSIFSGWEESKE
jgi:hypothetical protein